MTKPTTETEIPLPSDRSIGALFAALAAGIAAWQFIAGRSSWGWTFVVLAAAFGIVALAQPSLLRPLNRAWMGLAALMHRIVSPIVLGAMYFVVLTPVAVAMRIGKRDTLDRRRNPRATTYWKRRDPEGPDSSSFPRQY